MEKELQVVMRDAASLRRDFTRMGLTNNQRTTLESSTVFCETELGSFLEDSQEAGLDTALLAQVREIQKKRFWRYKIRVAELGKQASCVAPAMVGYVVRRWWCGLWEESNHTSDRS